MRRFSRMNRRLIPGATLLTVGSVRQHHRPVPLSFRKDLNKGI